MNLNEIETKLKLANRRIRNLEISQQQLLTRLTQSETELEAARVQLEQARSELRTKTKKRIEVKEENDNGS